ncbi:MAG: Gfo/Idh/MocA family oxidoreductase [Planctomycetaceae bacterium]|nr:Gfo/Idh/MocA family oxidoreductase [Planctomycetaceae bacterium]
MSKQTRRKFLGTSIAVAGAATMPYASWRPAKAAQGPNERLRVAVLGLNGRGSAHVEGFSGRNNCEVSAIIDPDEAVGQKAAEAIYKKTKTRPEVYKDMRQAFDSKDLNIASIATPNHWHSLAAIWAMQAGKDVYVEKPVSHNVFEGRQATAAARKHDRICQYGAQCRTMKGTRDMIAWLLEGNLGKVSLARGLCYKRRPSIGDAGKYPVPANVDYNIWLGPAPELSYVPRPKFHYDWHWQWPYGNGDLGNQGIHQMDIARWGLGWPDLGEAIVAYGGRLGYEDAGETANTHVCIHTRGDQTLVFETRGLETEKFSPMPDKIPGTGVGVVFYGEKGYAVQYGYNHSIAYDLDGNVIKEFRGGETNDHFDNFVKGVREHDHTLLNGDIEDGHLSSALCHLGNISYRLGEKASLKEIEDAVGNDEAKETLARTVEHLKKNNVDLDKTPMALGPKLSIKDEKFTGERADEANKHISREYRAPFIVPETKDL